MNKPLLTATTIVIALLFGCAAPPPVITPLLSVGVGDIQNLQNRAELQSLLQQLKTDLQGKDPQLYASDIGKIAILEDQIVNVVKNQLETRLTAVRLPSGLVPLNILSEESGKLTVNSLIPATKWRTLTERVDAEKAKTNEVLGSEKAKIGNATDQERLALLDTLYSLSGDQSWLNQKQQQLQEQEIRLTQLVDEIEAAQAGEEIDPNLQEKIAEAKRLAMGNNEIIDRLIGVDADIYQQRFFAALAEGEADKAYEIFHVLSSSDDFDKYKEKLSGTSQKMADYFIALADESVKDPKNLRQSFRWYSQARDIRDTFGVENPNREGELALIEQLEYQSAVADQQDSYSKALAYIYMAEDLHSSQADLRRKIQLAEEKVRDIALIKVSTTAFQTKEGQSDYSDAVAANITQYLFEKIPNDVRIVEREQYEAIEREKNLNNTMADLSAVDVLVTGSVDSNVETTKAEGKKTVRVVTGKETIPNPAYIAWLEKAEREREKIAKPSDTIEKDKQENIPINITRHRKVGSFSVSYRLVDADSGKIIFPDSVKKDFEYTDESSEGIEMGDFVLPFKLAELPSDSEVLNELAVEVSNEIGSRLVAQLENQDQQYLRQANDFSASNACNAEVDMLGKAIVIMDMKNIDSADARARFTSRAIACE